MNVNKHVSMECHCIRYYDDDDDNDDDDDYYYYSYLFL